MWRGLEHGFYGIAADYLAFARVFLTEGRAEDVWQVLRLETVRLMAENAMGELNVRALPAASPYSNEAEFFPGFVHRGDEAFEPWSFEINGRSSLST